jgi:hypothetical protein
MMAMSDARDAARQPDPNQLFIADSSATAARTARGGTDKAANGAWPRRTWAGGAAAPVANCEQVAHRLVVMAAAPAWHGGGGAGAEGPVKVTNRPRRPIRQWSEGVIARMVTSSPEVEDWVLWMLAGLPLTAPETLEACTSRAAP